MSHVDVRQANDVIIVDFRTRLVAGFGDELLGEVMSELLTEGYKKILLNLSEVDFIDSSGLGELVQSYKLAQKHEAALKLLQPQDRVRKTLQLTKVLPLFEIHETEADALQSFV